MGVDSVRHLVFVSSYPAEPGESISRFGAPEPPPFLDFDPEGGTFGAVADFAQVLRVAKKQGWTVAAPNLGIDTGTVNGRLVASIVMSVAEWAREVISERTVEALAEVRESGVRLGRPILMPADVVTRVGRLRTKGHALRVIAEQLNTCTGT